MLAARHHAQPQLFELNAHARNQPLAKDPRRLPVFERDSETEGARAEMPQRVEASGFGC